MDCVRNYSNKGLSSYDAIRLIEKIQEKYHSDEFTIECIENHRKLKFNNMQITQLLINVNNSEMIYHYLKKWQELRLSEDNIVSILRKDGMEEYSKTIFENFENLNFSSKNKYSFLSEINDKKYLKHLMKSGKLDDMDSFDISRLVYQTLDSKLIKACLKEKFKFRLEKQDIEALENLSKQIEISEKSEKEILKTIKNQECNSTINLPEKMTIGMEIECVGPFERKIAKRIFEKIGNWKVIDDDSICVDYAYEDSKEITSPILKSEDKAINDEIIKTCSILKYFGDETNKSCGAHVHIGGKYLNNVNSFQNLIELWVNTEKIIYLICNEAGEIPRSGVELYAVPLSKKFSKAMQSGSVTLLTEQDLSIFKSNLRVFESDRYKGLNMINITPQVEKINHMPTIEFRIANGTINPETWISNINLFGGIVATAKYIDDLESKQEFEKSEVEKEYLKKFYDLKFHQHTDDEKFEILMDLVFRDGDDKIYRKRYYENLKLLNRDFRAENYFETYIENGPMHIDRKNGDSKIESAYADRKSVDYLIESAYANRKNGDSKIESTYINREHSDNISQGDFYNKDTNEGDDGHAR